MNHSLDTLFKPRSVALIGASVKEYSIGNVIIKNLIHYGYTGKIFPVNPKEKSILGLKAYRSVSEIKENIDLVHIIIPPLLVPKEVESCGKKGVKIIIINSAGFKELGKKGAKIEAEFLATAKKYNIRIFGPNCQGIINSDPAIKAYCNFTFTFFKPGNISIVAQSGGVGQIITQALHDKNIGIRYYASNGNASDVSIPEIIRYYGNDKKTKVIIISLESIADTEEFIKAATEVSAIKPILGISSGKTKAGAEASKSHTGKLSEGFFTDVVFKKSGILLFDNLEDIYHTASAFATQPIPKGNRVGIITNTGGPAIIATDELVKNGLVIPPLKEATKKKISGRLLTASSISNPLDILATADASHFKTALETMLNETGIDGICIVFVTPIFVDCENVAKEIASISKSQKKPIVCNLITDKQQWKETYRVLSEGNVPVFDFPETAAKVLASLVKYHKIKNRKKGRVKQFSDINKNAVGKILEKAKKEKRSLLSATETYTLLEAYRIPTAKWKIAKTIDEAVVAANKLGYPVVVKADYHNIVHKSDVGGIALNLKNKIEVSLAVTKMQKTFRQNDLSFFIQKYLPSGTELIVGAKVNHDGRHLIMFGSGGILVDLYKDLAYQLTSVTDEEALRLIESTCISTLFENYRGIPKLNKKEILNIVQRISQFVCDFPQIKELDINPFKAGPDGIVVVDARIICNS